MPNYEYMVDTDVITPVMLYTSGEINPDSPAKVTFRIKVLIVVIGIILLLTANLKERENKPYDGGVSVAAVSFK